MSKGSGSSKTKPRTIAQQKRDAQKQNEKITERIQKRIEKWESRKRKLGTIEGTRLKAQLNKNESSGKERGERRGVPAPKEKMVGRGITRRPVKQRIVKDTFLSEGKRQKARISQARKKGE